MLVFVAGGAGLLGAAVGQALLSEGKHIVLADVFDESGDGAAAKEERAERLGRHPWARIVRGDLVDAGFVESVLRETQPTAVVNAAVFAPGTTGALTLLNGARAAGLGFFVHLSDGALYGEAPAPGRHAAEDEPLAPAGDPLLELRAREEGFVWDAALPATVLRVFEVVGPALGGRRFPASELDALLAGDTLPALPAGERDYLHVRDAVRAVLLALELRPSGATLNVGSGIGTSPREVVRRLATLAEAPAPACTEHTPARPARVADVERVHESLGFAPELGLDRALEELVRVRLGRPAAAAGDDRRRDAPRPLSRRDLFGMFRRPRED
jgi:nucleoside-diphosphate-sugar epimerase